jgi:hypothetical protein
MDRQRPGRQKARPRCRQSESRCANDAVPATGHDAPRLPSCNSTLAATDSNPSQPGGRRGPRPGPQSAAAAPGQPWPDAAGRSDPAA